MCLKIEAVGGLNLGLNMKAVSLLQLLCFLIPSINAKPEGAPDTPAVCQTMKPGHRSPPQRTPIPFAITINEDYYEADTTTLKVMINSTTSRPFRGFLIQARRADWSSGKDTTEPIGFFVAKDGTQHVCNDDHGVALTHTQSSPGSDLAKNYMELMWEAPKTSQGHVQFWMTLVTDYDTYWVGEKSRIIYDRKAPPMPATTSKPISSAVSSKPIDVGGCGSTKGCYRNPEGCLEYGCNIILTWRNAGSFIEFELSANTEGWVAVGFSDDKKMGNDDVYECVWSDEKAMVEVRQSYNDGKLNIMQKYDPPLVTNTEGYRADGRIRCRFSRDTSLTLDKLADFTEDKYILLAKGDIDDKGMKERHALEPNKYPYVSKRKVKMTEVDDIHGTAKYWMVKLHGCLMLLGWMLCAPAALIIAKYYKLMWPNDRLCRERVWFSVHRGLMLTNFFLTIISFVIIFLFVWGYSAMPELPDKAHPILGIIVTICTFINPLLALCRCNPKSSKRPIFNWIHWFFGTVGSVLAVPALFIGLNLHKAFVPWWATWVMVAFMLFHLVVELMLEIHGCVNARKQKSRNEEFEMKRKGVDGRGDYYGLEPEPVGTHFKKRILTVYCIVAVILTLVMVITVAVG